MLVNKLLKLGVGVKLSISFIFIVLLTSALISFFVLSHLERTLKDHIMDTIKKEIASREKDIRNALLNGDYWSIFKHVDALAKLRGIKEVAVVNDRGFVIAHSDPMEYPIDSYLPDYAERDKISIESYNYILGYIVYKIDHELIEESLLPFKIFSMGSTLFFSFIGASMGIFISFRISTRLRRVLDMIRNFEKGKLERVEFLEKDEINTFADYTYKTLLGIDTMIKNSLFERDFYHNLVDSLQDVLLILDEEGKIYYTNKAIKELGFSYEELLGRSVFILIKDPRDRKRLRRSIRAKASFTGGLRIRKGNGELFGAVSLKPLGEAFVVSIKDITEARRMEVFYMLGELSAGIAHELKNALLPIKLLMDVSSWDEEDIKVVRSAINRINRTVDDVLSLAGSGVYREDLINSKELINSWLKIYEPLIKTKGVEVIMDVEDFSFITNKHAFSTIFNNLFKNALEAVEEGKGVVKLSLKNSMDRVLLKIEDNGPGIPLKYREKIFEPFFSTKGHMGTGLGLPLVLKYVYDLGGHVEMETEEGKGTIFTVEVPVKYGEKGTFGG
ncbi:MAG: two-component system sensor histidine kinase NtrB [Aquificaceae bacterium]